MEIIDLIPKGVEKTIKYMREASRGIIIQGTKILISHEELDDIWTIPGGGTEDGESSEQCCAREVLEETGCVVSVGEWVCTVIESYDEEIALHKYFVCEITGRGERRPTEHEARVGAHPEWMDVDEYLSVIKARQSIGTRHVEPHRVHIRDYRALTTYLKQKETTEKQLRSI